MGIYPALHRLGIRPWERYARVQGADVAARLDRERAAAGEPPGRALDLGCGRGMHTPKLAERGWEAVGVDLVPSAIEHARAADRCGVRYEVADVTALPASLGGFDFLLDVGCLQTLGSAQREAAGRSITARANPGARLLLLTFGKAWFSYEGLERGDVERALADWEVTEVAPAPTKGLGWPLSQTKPQWYRTRLRG